VTKQQRLQDLARRLRSIELKLDVLIEAQGLEKRLADREAADHAAAAPRREAICEQFGRSRVRWRDAQLD
jgi:hypothetical protein